MIGRKLSVKRSNGGFSLMELIIVIAIVAVIIGVATPLFIRHLNNSQQAKDLYTADRIATAAYVAFAANIDAYDTYHKSKDLAATVSATVDGVTETYKVYLIAASEGPEYCFKGGVKNFGKKDGSTGFYGTLNEAMGLSTTEVNSVIIPRYKAQRKGAGPKSGYAYTKVDRWRICKRADNDQLEVWVAQPHPYGGYPIYRLWPNPDDEYTKKK